MLAMFGTKAGEPVLGAPLKGDIACRVILGLYRIIVGGYIGFRNITPNHAESNGK